MSHRPSRLTLWAPPLGWMALIFLASSLRYPDLGPDVPDKPVHFLLYAVLGVLLARAFARGLGNVGFRAAGGAFMLSCLYAFSDEFHQRFVPGRHASWADLLADGLGALVAVVAVWLLGHVRRPT